MRIGRRCPAITTMHPAVPAPGRPRFHSRSVQRVHQLLGQSQMTLPRMTAPIRQMMRQDVVARRDVHDPGTGLQAFSHDTRIHIIRPMPLAAPSRFHDLAPPHKTLANDFGGICQHLVSGAGPQAPPFSDNQSGHPFFRHSRPSVSAIWTAFRAAPLRRLSDTHHRLIPLSIVLS